MRVGIHGFLFVDSLGPPVRIATFKGGALPSGLNSQIDLRRAADFSVHQFFTC